MLIIPVLNKTDKKSIPYTCLALILLNAFIFIFIQSGDSSIEEKAYTYYEESGLQSIELNAYREYLLKNGKNIPERMLEHPDGRNLLTMQMFSDKEFHNLLVENRIISPNHSDFQEWREKRDEFEAKQQQTVIQQYGYSPDRANYIGLFTCMFLHGGVMHLVGNMVFLWLVGAILEKAIGPALFLVLYIIAGICASMLFGLVYPLSTGPLVGASGAIAGLMGAYGVVFGLRRIRVFYSIGFYFDYATVPALALFPVWLINEFIQLNTNHGSNVAYMAHIGGLLSGVLIGTCYRFFFRNRIDALFRQEEKKNKLETLLESGMEKLIQLRLQDARHDFDQVLSIEPANKTAIRQLFEIDKTSPTSDAFHQSSHRLLQSIKNANQGDYLKIFEEYKCTSSKPRITTEILEHIAYLYLNDQNFPKATICISAMLKRSPNNSKLPGYLMALAHGYRQTNKLDQADKCYQLLAVKFATSLEGQQAATYLEK